MRAPKNVAVVTGANKGIGFQVAWQMAKAGWIVFTASRSEELGKQAVARLQKEGLAVQFLHVDLDTPETAVRAAEIVREQFGKLDLLVNNAGVASPGDGPPSRVTLESVKRSMQTNFIGTIAVTQAMLPLLHAAGRAQIINVSTELGCISQQTNPDWKYVSVKLLGYCASKAALNMLSVQLAYEFRDKNIAVNSVDPGYTATELNGNSGPQTVAQGAAKIVRLALSQAPVSGRFLDADGELPW